MAMQRNIACGDWLDIPAEAMRSEQAFRRWYQEHHWPYCSKNPRKRAFEKLVAKLRFIPTVYVVQFSHTLNHPELEVIPERAAGLWRVHNRRQQSWPIVREGDFIDITDIDDVKVIAQDVFDTQYEASTVGQQHEIPDPPATPAQEGAPIDTGPPATS